MLLITAYGYWRRTVLEEYQIHQFGALQKALYVFNMNRHKENISQKAKDKMADNVARACWEVIKDDVSPWSKSGRPALELAARIPRAEPAD